MPITTTRNKTPSKFELFLHENGYRMASQLPSGQWVGVHTFMFTTGLVYGIDRGGIAGRYCYVKSSDAVHALLLLATSGVESIGVSGVDPTGPWIKHKGPGFDLSNTNMKEQI